MPSAKLPSPTTTLVQLTPSQAKRLYSVIQFYCVLKDALPQPSSANTSDDDSIVSTPDNDRALYKCFVNKVAQICDTKHGGDTVTSAMIVQPGQVEYWIASNSRNKTQMAAVKKFLSDDILAALKSMRAKDLEDETKTREFSSTLMKKIVAHCRWRFYKYVKGLVVNVGACIDSCARDNGLEASMSTRLGKLLPIAERVVATWPHDIISFVQQTHNLLQALEEAYTSSFSSFLRGKAGDDERRDTAPPWSETRHAIGRLHSYTIAVRVFIAARKKWPDLFESPEVIAYASPPKLGNPLQIKERMCTGKDLLNRVTTDGEAHAAYQSLLPHFQAIDFDARLKESIKDPKCITTVHAEVTLLSRFHKEVLRPSPGREDAHWTFFMEDRFGRYIGCSKPTCLLCDYYFDSFPIKVDRRPGHGNLYHKWRVADIQGPVDPGVERLIEDRKNTIEKMIKKLKDEVTRVLKERRGLKGSKYDSRHTPSDPFGSVVTAAGSVRGHALSDGPSIIGLAQIGHGSVGNGSVTGRTKFREVILEEVVEGENEDDGNGGECMEGESVEELGRLMGQLGVSGGLRNDEDDDDDEGGAKI
ncbi:hypothetical protein QBC40DRAFT_303419 [Triangularia verruculosa]|uniref:Uncharacterized protein n=1 Tax=Triangularia verruculosa TaxID=2587418 RepID=A0AAN6XVM2_9PEZI|nr:hypothetical protein QBC40DRAFT_303419 [Triangularia verruculosa]